MWGDCGGLVRGKKTQIDRWWGGGTQKRVEPDAIYDYVGGAKQCSLLPPLLLLMEPDKTPPPIDLALFGKNTVVAIPNCSA